MPWLDLQLHTFALSGRWRSDGRSQGRRWEDKLRGCQVGRVEMAVAWARVVLAMAWTASRESGARAHGGRGRGERDRDDREKRQMRRETEREEVGG